MHSEFSNWYQPATFGHDSTVFELRWSGVDQITQSFTEDKLYELVKIAFDKPSSQEVISEFREVFRTFDTTFQTSGNDMEVKILASAVLAYMCSDSFDETNKIALSILTTSFNEIRKLDGNIDLISLAENAVKKVGVEDRLRPTSTEIKKVGVKKRNEDAVAAMDGTHDTLLAGLKKIIVNLESVTDSIQDTFNGKIGLLENHIAIQDEEIEILWWLIGGWSEQWNCSFDEIDKKIKPYLLSHDVYLKTSIWSEPPSISSLFVKAGILEDDALNIKDSLDSVSEIQVNNLKLEGVACPVLHPLHFALAKKEELQEAWLVVWEKKTGISPTAESSALNLAIQFYRESLLLG